MEFKSSNTTFDNKERFSDNMKRFVSDEAARFTTGGNEAASASIDETIERGIRFSAEKSRGKVKEHKKNLLEIKSKKEEILSGESINPSTEENSSSSYSSKEQNSKAQENSKFEEGTSKEAESKEAESKEASSKDTKKLDSKAKSEKKAKSKEGKKAAAKTALASVFKAKKEFSNELASDKSTGDALRDGNTGIMRVFTEFINPMRYVKSLGVKILGVIMPYILAFMAVFSILLIIVSFVFSVLQPIAEVGEAISSFISFFVGDDDEEVFKNDTLASDEIDEIVSASGADETQEKVIRYALSKVGYPYSQENRTSGTAYDCSSLVYYAWDDAGVDISYGTDYPPTAADGAKRLEADGKKVDATELKPGDLVYYGGEGNGRYMGIYHVAMYVGEGMAVEALNTDYGVVYQKLRISNAIMVCRPNKE